MLFEVLAFVFYVCSCVCFLVSLLLCSFLWVHKCVLCFFPKLIDSSTHRSIQWSRLFSHSYFASNFNDRTPLFLFFQSSSSSSSSRSHLVGLHLLVQTHFVLIIFVNTTFIRELCTEYEEKLNTIEVEKRESDREWMRFRPG